MILRILYLIILLPSCVFAADLHLAVAANFSTTIDKLKVEFENETNTKIIISKGSTGKLYAQIINGAPFDLFLSADQKSPTKLEEQDLIEPSSKLTYAIGKLALWAPGKNICLNCNEVLQKLTTERIAVANPNIAPFGLAAKQYLSNLGIYNQLQHKLITGEDINQTFSFVATGNVEYGIVSLSQILQHSNNAIDNSVLIIPENLYDPIIQQVVLLKRTKNKSLAEKFLKYLLSKPAKEIILASGYKVTDD